MISLWILALNWFNFGFDPLNSTWPEWKVCRKQVFLAKKMYLCYHDWPFKVVCNWAHNTICHTEDNIWWKCWKICSSAKFHQLVLTLNLICWWEKERLKLLQFQLIPFSNANWNSTILSVSLCFFSCRKYVVWNCVLVSIKRKTFSQIE